MSAKTSAIRQVYTGIDLYIRFGSRFFHTHRTQYIQVVIDRSIRIRFGIMIECQIVSITSLKFPLGSPTVGKCHYTSHFQSFSDKVQFMFQRDITIHIVLPFTFITTLRHQCQRIHRLTYLHAIRSVRIVCRIVPRGEVSAKQTGEDTISTTLPH